jgi:hypothetical protein
VVPKAVRYKVPVPKARTADKSRYTPKLVFLKNLFATTYTNLKDNRTYTKAQNRTAIQV